MVSAKSGVTFHSEAVIGRGCEVQPPQARHRLRAWHEPPEVVPAGDASRGDSGTELLI
jgi:hypothetical protein